MKQGFGFEKGVKKTVQWTVFSPRPLAANPSAGKGRFVTQANSSADKGGFVTRANPSAGCLVRFRLDGHLRIFGITDASYGKPAMHCRQ